MGLYMVSVFARVLRCSQWVSIGVFIWYKSCTSRRLWKPCHNNAALFFSMIILRLFFSVNDCCVMPYCDNVHVVSLNPELSQHGKDAVVAKLESLGFSPREHTGASTVTQTLAGILYGHNLGKFEVRQDVCGPLFMHSSISQLQWCPGRRFRDCWVMLCAFVLAIGVVFQFSGGCMILFIVVVNPVFLTPRRNWNVLYTFADLFPLQVADLRRPWSHFSFVRGLSLQEQGVHEVGKKRIDAVEL